MHIAKLRVSQSRSRIKENKKQKAEKINKELYIIFSLSLFSILIFKSCKVNREREGENTKACVLIFYPRAPPGPLKLA